MKKILSTLLIFGFLGLNIPAYTAGLTSDDGFSIPIPAADIPPGSNSANNGLSSGAIVGIALGSAAGLAAIGGLAWWYQAKGIAAGAAAAYISDLPVLPMCLDNTCAAKLAAQGQKYNYLVKAMRINGVRPCPCARYILIPDSYVGNQTYNSVAFKIPKEMIPTNNKLSLKVTQVSDPFEDNEFEGRIFQDIKSSQKTIMNSEVKIKPTSLQASQGVVQKEGKIVAKNKSLDDAVIVISYNKSTAVQPLRYAYVIELSYE